MAKDLDQELMRRAITLGEKGDPSPNPHVGCVVADEAGQVLGEGFHEATGLDHAEVAALKAAGSKARGQVLYVSMEPCNHQGRTPPCVDAILAAGIKRVVIGCRDPNPRVPGGGLERLRAAGVIVDSVLEGEGQALIKGWTKFITTGMSYLTLKLAISLDGRIATRTGASKWITGPESRLRVQTLRARHDAVMVGVNTVLADDPRLTVRDLPGRSPVRVIVDSKLRMPPTAQVAQTATQTPTCVVTTLAAPKPQEEALQALGVRVIRVPPTAEGRCDPTQMLRELAAREVVSVMCEGGSELGGSLLASQLADELHVFVAPVLLGPRGRPGAVDWAGPESPSDAPRIDPPRWELNGGDAYVWGPLKYPTKTSRTSPG